MSKNYIFNLETGKIELHFEKSEYAALSDAEKAKIKSNFLWSRTASAWVSRCKEPNLYHARKVAEELGFTGEERVGERLSYAEQIERKAERAEARAERYETYAENAAKRADGLQAAFNERRGDIAWLTQPVISGHSGSQRFARQRERIMNAYDKGFEEYRKSSYFADKAEVARETASMAKLKDPVYLEKKIKEAKKEVKIYWERIVQANDLLFKIENGEKPTHYDWSKRERVEWTAEEVIEAINRNFEMIEVAMDKQGYFENCMDAIGGIKFSRENLKPGYIVRMKRWGRYEVIKANPTTVEYKILEGGAAGLGGKESYGAIAEILEMNERVEAEGHPFKEGEIFAQYDVSGRSLIRAYRITKTTPKTVKMVQIPVKDGTPIVEGEAKGPEITKKPTVSKFDGEWTIYIHDWRLYKWAPQATTA